MPKIRWKSTAGMPLQNKIAQTCTYFERVVGGPPKCFDRKVTARRESNICAGSPAEEGFIGFSRFTKNIMFSVCTQAQRFYVINSMVAELSKKRIASGKSLKEYGSNNVMQDPC
jgi:hypothetical protein